MKRRTLLASGASAALAAAIGAPLRAQAKTKVGFIYVGPINDGGWTQHHHESAKQMVEHFGGAIDFVYQESVPEGPDAERAITQMCLGGANLIFTTSFGYMDATINVASKFPNVKFEHATGYKMADNVGVYSARFYEGRAIQGTLAGRMTKTNKVGYIASVPIPEVVRGINAAFLHARKVNPNVEFKIIWIFEWLNPAKEADAAKALSNRAATWCCNTPIPPRRKPRPKRPAMSIPLAKPPTWQNMAQCPVFRRSSTIGRPITLLAPSR